jgi:undecaprenyl-diphosphatase
LTFLLSIILLAIVQGLAELLPVSSSAHVIIAEKVLGLDPTTPEMTLLLVMLHTGTMLAVIIYFRRSWKDTYFSSRRAAWRNAKPLFLSIVMTGLVGMAVKTPIERYAFRSTPHAEIELLFGNLPLIATALAAVGIFIIYAGLRYHGPVDNQDSRVKTKQAIWIGAVQGLCLPFRGFSRSGATISCGLVSGISKQSAEDFSFALAVILTPPVVIREVMRLITSRQALVASGAGPALSLFLPGLLGLVCSFFAGIFALQWLTRWLDRGKWHYFGYYCLCAAVVVLTLHRMGY